MSADTPQDVRSDAFKYQLDRFKLAHRAEGCHWTFGFADSGPGLFTSFWTPELVVKSEEYEKDFPYKLDKDQTALFPEWYFNFLLKFSERSLFHKHYCSVSGDEFFNLLLGAEPEKKAVFASLDWEFSTALKAGLDPLLLERYKSIQLTRKYTETELVREFADSAFWTDTLFRYNELFSGGMSGEIVPLVRFMMAFDESEENIWVTICGILVRHCRTKERAKLFRELSDLHFESKFPLISRVQEFNQSLIENHLRIPLKKPVDEGSQGTKQARKHPNAGAKTRRAGKAMKFDLGQTPGQAVGESRDFNGQMPGPNSNQPQNQTNKNPNQPHHQTQNQNIPHSQLQNQDQTPSRPSADVAQPKARDFDQNFSENGQTREHFTFTPPNPATQFPQGQHQTTNPNQNKTPLGKKSPQIQQNQQKPGTGSANGNTNANTNRTPIHSSRQRNVDGAYKNNQLRGKGKNGYNQEVRRRPVARERHQVTPPMPQHRWGDE